MELLGVWRLVLYVRMLGLLSSFSRPTLPLWVALGIPPLPLLALINYLN